MHILLVNDDGWFAEGIQTLAKTAQDLGHRVTICAPDRQRSGAGHAFTMEIPLHAKKLPAISVAPGWMVDGTPADCAHLGAYLLREEGVDLCVSGINAGANTGSASVYSGTIAAAMEASMVGLPAIAASFDQYGEVRAEGFAIAAKKTLEFAKWAMEHPLGRGEIYNLNVPDLPEGEILGFRQASLAPLYLETPNYEMTDSELAGRYYFYANGENIPMTDPESDVRLLEKGYMPVTALTWNCVCSMPKMEI